TGVQTCALPICARRTLPQGPRLAWNDERGFASEVIPGADLAEVFGARESVIRPVDRAEIEVGPGSGLLDFAPHTKIYGEGFEEQLEPLADGKAIAGFTDGGAAVVVHSYGKGRAILVGTFLALAYHRHQDLSNRRFL